AEPADRHARLARGHPNLAPAVRHHRESGPGGLRPPPGLGASSGRGLCLRGGVLDDGDDAAGHEASRANDLAAPGGLGNFDGPAGDQHVDASPFPRRYDLEAADLVAGIDEDLDPVPLHRPQRLGRQRATSPPSAIRTWPVTKLAASEARNNAGPTISSGPATR